MHNSNTLAQNLIYLAYSIEREMPSTFQEYNDQYFNEIERYQAEEEARRGQDEQEAEDMRREHEREEAERECEIQHQISQREIEMEQSAESEEQPY